MKRQFKIGNRVIGENCPAIIITIMTKLQKSLKSLKLLIPTTLEPHEFKQMAEAIRVAEKALVEVSYAVTEKEADSRVFRRSLFAVKDLKAGGHFTDQNARVIRPGFGMHPRFYKDIIVRRAAMDISRGTPLTWEMVSDEGNER